jgi:hypothetical protein
VRAFCCLRGLRPPDLGAGALADLTDKDAVQDLISGIEYEPLQVRPVSTAVNKTGRGGSRGPELIQPLGDQADQALQLVPACRPTRSASGAAGK